jgi:hypothetical protein
MVTKDDWLPVGSIVMLADAERPIMVAGYMAKDGITNRYYDYLGYPYPEGRQDRDYFFDKSMIEKVLLVGYLDADGLQLQKFLEAMEDEYRQIRQQQAS